MNFILTAVIVLGLTALIAAVILYVCSKRFAVKEDPRIGAVTESLPGANCGGCGYPGCSGMAAALVKAADAGSLDGLNCPVGGSEVMGKVADLLGLAVANAEPKVAVVRCNGTCENRPRIASYDGLQTCAAMNATGAGETACGYGCLGCGDCVAACQFGALSINEATGSAMKACKAACIGCGKCVKECKFEAITLDQNVSYIDPEKCRLCKKCVEACPTKAIHAVNFPAPKPKPVVVEAASEKETPNNPKEEEAKA